MEEKEEGKNPFDIFGLTPPRAKGFWAKLNQWFLVKTLVKYHIIPGDNYWKSSFLTVWYQLAKINYIIKSGKAKTIWPPSDSDKKD